MDNKNEPIKQRVRRMLDENGINYSWLDHEKVFSMEDCEPIGRELGARHCKNLLLGNRQLTQFYLLLTDNKPFKTAVFSKALGISRVSFVPGEMMPDVLGVIPGSASPLALINDEEQRVKLVVDSSIITWPRICLHPGDSTASLAMDMVDLLLLCRNEFKHEYSVVEL